METAVGQVWHAIMIQIVELVDVNIGKFILASSSQIYSNIVYAIKNDVYLNQLSFLVLCVYFD